MANEFKHKSVGSELSQTEFESTGGHVFDSQAIGDLVYASSTTALLRLPIGSTDDVLTIAGGIPAWDSSWSPAGDITLADTVDLLFGTGSDAGFRWSTGDASNHSLVLGLDNTGQQLHITDQGAIATDWARSAGTHPEVSIHSNTTPATDYLAIGNHDGTTASIDVVGGTTLALAIAGNTELTVTASGLNLPANSDILFGGTTGTNDITLTDSLADALSITRGGTDMVVFNSSTPSITFTPAITASGGISGNLTGNASGTAATVTGGTQAAITSTANLVTVGTIGTGVWEGTDVGVGHGGTGASTATAGFDALSPMTAEGDILYGGSSGTVTKLAKGSDADVLTLASGVPSWATPTTGDITGVTAGVGLSGGGSSGGVTLTLDLSELSAVTPTSGDWFSTLDSDDANEQLTTTDALATLFAGAGMTATSAVVNVIAGTGIDVTADEVAVDVSDFMSNGTNNYVVTATGTDAMNAEAQLTFDGDVLAITGTGTAKANKDILTITNDVNAADMDGTETSILFNQWYYDGSSPAIADAGRISVGTEQDWTSTASTQDSYIAFEAALNGTVTERLRVSSDGAVGIGGANYGTDGQVLTSAGASAASAWEDIPAGGIARAEMWRVTTDNTISQVWGGSPGDDIQVIVNWELNDQSGTGVISSGMAESSGVFTFPQTGIWQVDANFHCIGNYFTVCAIDVTEDDSSWVRSNELYIGTYTVNFEITGMMRFIFDVADVSNDKVRFGAACQATSGIGRKVKGDTARTESWASFIRLGDT